MFDKNKPIDFIITWVDPSDTAWQKEKAVYDGSTVTAANSEVRYRDWDNLQYWFRAVEKYAPWVNKIHFVTWGHTPLWLDTENPKLNIVNHKDFIPEEYLPTFSSHTIELNLHKIEGLSEQFVYFNDDIFLNKPVSPEDFFKGGLPMDTAALNCVYFNKDTAAHYQGSDITVINSNFELRPSIKANLKKWISLKNGKKNVLRTLLLSLWHWFPGFYYQHGANGYLKSTFAEVWEKEFDILDTTCRHRFRGECDANQWVMKFWQLASGRFEVRDDSFVYCRHISEDNFEELCREIPLEKHGMICINDTEKTIDFEEKKTRILAALNKILPERSQFEKDI
ncbi:MAG: stealth family protein [Oscillospiraceae bacterium]|nr:stealth family protein [Oscillospiraceae bacterium]